jgi:putative oxidoreductase
MTTTIETVSTSILSPLAAPGRALKAGLWAAQFLLALTFGFAGATKAFVPVARVAQMIPWAADVPAALLRFIGAMELLASVGLLLPSLLRVRPRLTPLAALGLVVLMTVASGFHALRHEAAGIAVNAALAALAAFVAWGRLRAAPLGSRS